MHTAMFESCGKGCMLRTNTKKNIRYNDIELCAQK
jgi:hypothetical protein